jgi:hypothetical protein
MNFICAGNIIHKLRSIVMLLFIRGGVHKGDAIDAQHI